MTTFFIVLLVIIALSFLFVGVLIYYFVLLFLMRFFGRLFNLGWLTNKKVVLAVSLCLAVSTVLYFLFSSPASNSKTAYIEKQQSQYKVTLCGKRVGMAHDPVSALFRTTYPDTIFYFLPRRVGVIMASEISVGGERYKPSGSITIDKKKMDVKMYYDEQQKDPDSWNGNYNLEWK
jgi:hypothetical protein